MNRRIAFRASRPLVVATIVLLVLVLMAGFALYGAAPASAHSGDHIVSITITGQGAVGDCNEGEDPCELSGFEHGAEVELTATPDAGWELDHWGGACTGRGLCFLTLLTPFRSVSATFRRITPMAAAFDWSMPDRARDGNNDGLLDLETPPAGGWAPSAWTVRLDACASSGGGQEITSYRWEIEGLPTQDVSRCATLIQVPEEREYPVTLTITTADGTSAHTTRDVTVQDRFIVVMGDSTASGEGNPEGRIVYGEFGVDSPPRWSNTRCHRSGRTASAIAALALERQDPHSSVTFLIVACSGATIREGIIGPYQGIEPKNPDDPVPPQLLQVKNALGGFGGNGRMIDDLIIAIGANDVGFAKIGAHCLLWGNCHLDEALNAELAADLAALPQAYDIMRNHIDWPYDLDVRSTYITEYPDFSTDWDGDRCDEIGRDIIDIGIFWTGMGRAEANWAANAMLWPLNEVLQAQVAKARGEGKDWRYVDISSTWTVYGLYGHGYCIGNPKIPTPQRWIRTFSESCDLQGPPLWVLFGAWACFPGANEGLLHPNEYGHEALAQRYLSALRANAPPGPPPPPLAQHRLSVLLTGAGRGVVVSSPAGIECGAECSQEFDTGTVVTLTATPSTGSAFSGWSGSCSGTGATCSVAVSEAKTVGATFSIKRYQLSVGKSGTGSGLVESNPPGLECGGDCSEEYVHGAQVTLTASPATDSSFAGWTGACTGASVVCLVTMDAAKSVTAWFEVDTTPPLIVAEVSPGANAAGWHNGDVSVSWNIGDAETGIASSNGCGPAVLTAETPGTTLTCTATNGAGLQGSSSVTVRIDRTAPEASVQYNPATRDLLVLSRDGLSGPVSGAAPYTVLPGGDHYLVRDQAGNERTLVLVVERTDNGEKLTARLEGFATNKLSVEADNDDELVQKIDLGEGKAKETVKATYNGSRTKITTEKGGNKTAETKPGLVLLRLVTNGGQLSVEY